jgi:hypothetical protein
MILDVYQEVSNISFVDIQIFTMYLLMNNLETFIVDFFERIESKENWMLDKEAKRIDNWKKQLWDRMNAKEPFPTNGYSDTVANNLMTMWRKCDFPYYASDALAERRIANSSLPRSALKGYLDTTRVREEFHEDPCEHNFKQCELWYIKGGFNLQYPDENLLQKFIDIQALSEIDSIVRDEKFALFIAAMWDTYKPTWQTHFVFRTL